MIEEEINDRDANRVIVLEGTPFGIPVAKGFDNADQAEPFVIERVRGLVAPELRERFERAVADRLVSEDGVKATSAVLEGTLAYIRALAKAYSQGKIAITARRFDEDDDARR